MKVGALLVAALSPAGALRPAALHSRRAAPAPASLDRRALLGAAALAVCAPRSTFAADPVISEAQNLLDFEDKNSKGSDALMPKAYVKAGGLKGDIKVEMNVDDAGDQKYLWFTDAATGKVIAAKAVTDFGQGRGSFATRLPAGVTVIPTQYSRAYGVWEGAPLLVKTPKAGDGPVCPIK